MRDGDVIFVNGFIWLPEIIDKLAVKHHVSTDEAEEVFFNGPRFRFVESGDQAGEDVYAATGQTDAGRYLAVFFILKHHGQALILSAGTWIRKSGEDMGEVRNKSRTSISGAATVAEIGEYWDTHSLADHWDETREVDLEVRAERRRRVTLAPEVYSQIETQAQRQGILPETLVNLWLLERLQRAS